MQCIVSDTVKILAVLPFEFSRIDNEKSIVKGKSKKELINILDFKYML